MIDNNKKKQLLEKILTSSEFVNSPKNQKLLTFLINASINNQIPKEYDIAEKVFDRDAGFDPGADTIVRVSMHNLRIKLERYYEKEGKKDKIHIITDKGHYELKFLEKCHSPNENNNKISRIHLLGYAGLVAVILFLGYKTLTSQNKTDRELIKLQKCALWKDINNSDRTKRFVMGDEFFFIRYEDRDQFVIRRHDVNTIKDFDHYVNSQNDSFIREKTPYQYFPKMVVWPMGRIINILKPGTRIDFISSSLFKSSDMLNEDIIFIGSFRSLYLFNEIIKDLSFNYDWTPEYKNLSIVNKDTSITLTFEGEPGIKHTDYCYLRKLPGPSENTILMIFSSFYVGLAGVTEIITDYNKLKQLEQQIVQKLGYLPEHYNILFKSFGHSRTAFKTELVHIEAFNPDNIMW